ncbi:MAG: phosphoribosylamine--glycine ligase [bacterium]
MKVFVVGKGAREHALVWKILKSPLVKKVYSFPGNAGIAGIAEIPQLSDDSIETLCSFALKEGIDLTVVGPEEYLAKGIVDRFEAKGLKIFGTNKAASKLESSKVFAKEIMAFAKIPTASYSTVENFEKGELVLKSSKFPVVLKADGLAAGKGVVICSSYEEAVNELKEMLSGKFESAGAKVVIEEFLKGEELSLLLLTDGKSVKKLLFSQDHKALSDGDKGPNTGGMGAYTPVSFADSKLYEKVNLQITEPLLKELKNRGIKYKGVLYIGLMIVNGKPFVLEYNARFGDPETEPLLFMLKSDIVPYFLGSIQENLETLPELEWTEGYGVTTVIASGGYPGSYKKGELISGLDKVGEECKVFHAGTAFKDGKVVTDGGRVLMVTSSGETISKALENVYKNVEKIEFNNAFFRRDIAHRELIREKNDN